MGKFISNIRMSIVMIHYKTSCIHILFNNMVFGIIIMLSATGAYYKYGNGTIKHYEEKAFSIIVPLTFTDLLFNNIVNNTEIFKEEKEEFRKKQFNYQIKKWRKKK